MRRQVAALLQHDDETVQKVSGLPAEDILMRWVNYYLTSAKIMATELIDSAAKERVNDARSAWSARDAEVFRDRCKVIRSLQRITNLDVDLSDGVVLCALFATLRAEASGGALNPADLNALDERDLDTRAQIIRERYVRQMVPTEKAFCILQPEDITQGDPA